MTDLRTIKGLNEYDPDIVKFKVLQKTKALGRNTERSLFLDLNKKEVKMVRGNTTKGMKVWECSSFVKMESLNESQLNIVLKDTTSRATHREKKKILTFDSGEEREKFKMYIESVQDSAGVNLSGVGNAEIRSSRTLSSRQITSLRTGAMDFDWVQSIVTKLLLCAKEELNTLEGSVVYTCRSAGEEDLKKGIFFFTNYRLGFIPTSLLHLNQTGCGYKSHIAESFHHNANTQIRRSLQAMVTIPLLQISSVAKTSLQTGIILHCKDFRTATFHFNKSSAWVQTIVDQISNICFSENIEHAFAFMIQPQVLPILLGYTRIHKYQVFTSHIVSQNLHFQSVLVKL
jgi:hypothetical protein